MNEFICMYLNPKEMGSPSVDVDRIWKEMISDEHTRTSISKSRNKDLQNLKLSKLI